LSSRPCLERVRRLEAAGIIQGYQAIIAPELLARPVTIFAEITLEKHGRQDRAEHALTAVEELTECWQVTGDIDYLARFVCTDIARYETLSSALLEDAELGIARIVSHIALRPVRRFAGYPVALLVQQRDKAEL
ncbi:MAG: Lrp/AsnC family transcriptional regulator, partial [Xanthobacteraceae bacterium]